MSIDALTSPVSRDDFDGRKVYEEEDGDPSHLSPSPVGPVGAGKEGVWPSAKWPASKVVCRINTTLSPYYEYFSLTSSVIHRTYQPRIVAA